LRGGTSSDETNEILTVYFKELLVLYLTDGSGYFDGWIRIFKKRIRSLRIRIGNNGGKHSLRVHLANNVGRETGNIGISKKRGFLCDRWSNF